MPSRQPIASSIAKVAGHGRAWCVVPGCERHTVLVNGKGLSGRYCKHHIKFKARHGSVWHRSYSAADLRPYFRAAHSYINPRLLTDPSIKHAVERLAFVVEGAPYEQANRLRGLPATTRAEIAFGRFRKRGVKPEKLLAIALAVTALIAEDPLADKATEFRRVQIAKACHRRASGFHRVWSERSSLHIFARSTGRVLRILGSMIEERCDAAVHAHLEEILKLKVRRYGHYPGNAASGIEAIHGADSRV